MIDDAPTPYFLSKEPPARVTHPWHGYACVHGPAPRGYCERQRFKKGYRTNGREHERMSTCDCPCKHGELR